MIPIYRAKEVDSEDYIVGYLIKAEGGFWIDGEDAGHIFHREIDTSTLSINFENMIDKNDKRIFASLNEDGIGGDIVYIAGKGECTLTFDDDGANATIINNVNNIFEDYFSLSEALAEDDVERVIGIHHRNISN